MDTTTRRAAEVGANAGHAPPRWSGVAAWAALLGAVRLGLAVLGVTMLTMADGAGAPDHTVAACGACGKRNRIPRAAKGHPRCGRCGAALPWIVSATDSDFAAIAEGARLPVLVDLWAPWCGPCRVVSPMVERLATTHAGRLKVVKVNVDESPAVSMRFGVQGIPTLLVLRDGQVVDRQTGAPPEPVLRDWVDRALATV